MKEEVGYMNNPKEERKLSDPEFPGQEEETEIPKGYEGEPFLTNGIRTNTKDAAASEKTLSLGERLLRLSSAPGKALQGLNSSVLLAIASYAICSSCMLVVNKVTVHLIPAPSIVLSIQMYFSALFVKALKELRVIEVDDLEWRKIKLFWLVAFAFLAGIYANMKTLQYANVDTFIVIRSSTPLLIAVMDFVFLGRELPSLQSCCSLLVVVVGAAGYVITDANFQIKAYLWVVVWLLVFTFDQIYIKYVVDNVQMTTWGRVLYSNAIAALPVTILSLAQQEQAVLFSASWGGYAALALSCGMGLAMNHSAYNLRLLVSATSFTVIGTLCKILSVLVNCLIWDKHASSIGLTYLYVCLIAGSFYQQAPLRRQKQTSSI